MIGCRIEPQAPAFPAEAVEAVGGSDLAEQGLAQRLVTDGTKIGLTVDPGVDLGGGLDEAGFRIADEGRRHLRGVPLRIVFVQVIPLCKRWRRCEERDADRESGKSAWR